MMVIILIESTKDLFQYFLPIYFYFVLFTYWNVSSTHIFIFVIVFFSNQKWFYFNIQNTKWLSVMSLYKWVLLLNLSLLVWFLIRCGQLIYILAKYVLSGLLNYFTWLTQINQLPIKKILLNIWTIYSSDFETLKTQVLPPIKEIFWWTPIFFI